MLKKQNEKSNMHFTVWLINSPSVTLTLNANTTPFTKKNSELLIVFMAGYGKYVLENPGAIDEMKANLAGIRSAMKVYNLGGVKKDKKMLALIELEKAGTLEK